MYSIDTIAKDNSPTFDQLWGTRKSKLPFIIHQALKFKNCEIGVVACSFF